MPVWKHHGPNTFHFPTIILTVWMSVQQTAKMAQQVDGIPFSWTEYLCRVLNPFWLDHTDSFPWWYIPRWPFRCISPHNNRHLYDLTHVQWQGSLGHPSPKKGSPIKCVALGDFMPMSSPPAMVAPELLTLLKEAHVVIFNLETPLLPTNRDLPGMHCMSADVFQQWLSALGLDPSTQHIVATFANNHSYDHDWDDQHAATRYTCRQLEALGIHLVGVNSEPTILELHGQRVGFVGWTHWLNVDPAPHQYVQRYRDIKRRDWARVKEQLQLDWLIGLPHWGIEFEWYPNLTQQQQACDMFEAGFDVLLGAHPHTTQPVEVLSGNGRQGLVAYSLGDFNGLSMPLPQALLPLFANRHVRVGQALSIEFKTGAQLTYNTAWVEWHPGQQALLMTSDLPCEDWK
jgi:hypothetical protein